MNIKQQFASIDKALPNALYLLQDIDGIISYHAQQSKKHPFDIYLGSVNTIADAIVETIEQLELAKSHKKYQSDTLNWDSDLLKATRRLIDAIFIHFEDCDLIIESFFEIINCKECKQAKTQFKKSIKSYYDHIAIPVNYIKHRNSQLRSFCFYWDTDAILGFYLQSSVTVGRLGPDSDLHKDGFSAFSYNRELTLNLVNIFAVSASLVSTLNSINNKLSPRKSISYSHVFNAKWLLAVRKISSLPKFYFPDEVNMESPLVELKNNLVKIEYPAKNLKILKQPSGSLMTLGSEGSALSETYHVIPYYYLIDKSKPDQFKFKK